MITGASGFVASELVPRLAARGAELLLVGRDPEALARRFPRHRCCGYDALAEEGAGADLLLHLAVLNSDQPGSPEDFEKVNVTFAREVLSAGRAGGIGRFIYPSSVQAAEPRAASPYADSKRRGEAALRAGNPGDVLVLRLPLVHGSRYTGKLSVLNRVPRRLARLAFPVFASLKPTVEADKLAGFLTDEARNCPERIVTLTDGQGGNLVYRAVKRGGDLMFAAAVLLLFWWGLLGIWAAIRLGSPGPGIFTQTRVGRGGAPFTCYKFRTMKTGTAQAGTHEVSASAVTPVGAFLRRTKLDELPQVWNILRGEISLIGPRPCLPVQTELIEARRRRGVFAVLPGISGLAQVEGLDMSDPERLARRDAEYVALQSLLLDLRLMLATATGGGQGDRVRE